MVIAAPPAPVPAARRLAPSWPEPRGPISHRLLDALRKDRHALGPTPDAAGADEEDLQLALYLCYELHYGGLPVSDPEWEWEPSLLAVRAGLEECFMGDLERTVGPPRATHPGEVVERLWHIAGGGDGPSLSSWVERYGALHHLRELAVHRSAYQLKEADPHTWAIPRIGGRAKAAMVAIQSDEYGDGRPDAMHSALFADTMEALGLDSTTNRYLDRIPGLTLATTNLISMFGLHRRWRGALVGHLALFEMTSIGPMGRYAGALRRLGVDEEACRFYDVHVEADRLHQYLAADHMVAGLVEDEPELARDVLFGAAALSAVEARFTNHVLDAWGQGRSSLRAG